MFGTALITSGEEDAGSIVNARAANMNRYSPLALVCDGLARVWNGKFDEAAGQFGRAVELSSGDPIQRFAYAGLGKIATAREDWESALYWARVTSAISPGLSGAHVQRIAANAILGRMDEAQRCLQLFMSIAPGVTIRSLDAGQPYRNRSHLKPLLDGLKLAGLPDR